MRYFIWLLLALTSLFMMQGMVLSTVGGKTTKTESNFFSSIARIQTGVQQSPQIMLLGSSMTGRLPDRNTGFQGVANLGCDGGSAVDILRAIDQELLPAAPVLVIEGNTLHSAAGQQTSEIFQSIQSSWFRAGLRLQAIAANARPSAFAYTFLRSRKIGVAEGPDGPRLPVDTQIKKSWPETNLAPDMQPLLGELLEITERLKQRDIEMVMVILPPGGDVHSPKITVPYEVARLSGMPLIDLTEGLPNNAVRFSDAIHMVPASAAASLRSILYAIDGSS